MLAFALLLSQGPWLTYAADSSGTRSRYPNTYDVELEEAAKRFLPEYEWLWLKAQCYQESLLNPLAVSHAQAKGLCQFLDATWAEETNELRMHGASPFDPKANALVAAKYMAKLIRYWTRHDPAFDSALQIAQASYNAGIGNMRKFKRNCTANPSSWKLFEACVPFKETREYVERIQRHYDNMVRERENGVW